MIHDEQEEASSHNNFEVQQKLEPLLNETQSLLLEAGKLAEDSVTDEKFHLEDKKRQLAAEVYRITADKRANAAKADYLSMKEDVTNLIRESGNDHEKHCVREVIAREEVFLKSSNADSIEAATNELASIRYQILMRAPGFLIGIFEHLTENSISMNDQVQAKSLIANGKQLIEREAWDDLRIVIGRLWELMPAEQQHSNDARMFTGIV